MQTSQRFCRCPRWRAISNRNIGRSPVVLCSARAQEKALRYQTDHSSPAWSSSSRYNRELPTVVSCITVRRIYSVHTDPYNGINGSVWHQRQPVQPVQGTTAETSFEMHTDALHAAAAATCLVALSSIPQFHMAIIASPQPGNVPPFERGILLSIAGGCTG